MTTKSKKHKEEDIRKFLRRIGIPSLAKALTKVMPKKHTIILEVGKRVRKGCDLCRKNTPTEAFFGALGHRLWFCEVCYDKLSFWKV